MNHWSVPFLKKGWMWSVIVQMKTGISIKLIFVKNRSNKREWLTVLSTDLLLSDEEIIRIYGNWWSIMPILHYHFFRSVDISQCFWKYIEIIYFSPVSFLRISSSSAYLNVTSFPSSIQRIMFRMANPWRHHMDVDFRVLLNRSYPKSYDTNFLFF